jgi:hypothetical protein
MLKLHNSISSSLIVDTILDYQKKVLIPRFEETYNFGLDNLPWNQDTTPELEKKYGTLCRLLISRVLPPVRRLDAKE